MDTMSVSGAEMILNNGLEFTNVQHLESTETYHYFAATILVGGAQVRHEVRIDAERNIDEQFHIQSRSWGSEYWENIDSVSSDWIIDELE